MQYIQETTLIAYLNHAKHDSMKAGIRWCFWLLLMTGGCGWVQGGLALVLIGVLTSWCFKPVSSCDVSSSGLQCHETENQTRKQSEVSLVFYQTIKPHKSSSVQRSSESSSSKLEQRAVRWSRSDIFDRLPDVEISSDCSEVRVSCEIKRDWVRSLNYSLHVEEKPSTDQSRAFSNRM